MGKTDPDKAAEAALGAPRKKKLKPIKKIIAFLSAGRRLGGTNASLRNSN